jgi:23S rRNA (uracil1939-C5)-methyltransferase
VRRLRLDAPPSLRPAGSQGLAARRSFRDLGPIDVVSAGPELGYRTRLRLHVDEAGRLGLYEKRSHRIVEIPGCPVSSPGIDTALGEIRAAANGRQLALAAWSELEIRVAPAGPPVTLALRRRDPARKRSEDEAALLDELASRFPVVEIGDEPPPASDQRWPLPGGIELHVPPGGFVQVNWAVNEKLVAALVEGATTRQVRRFLDLYCGAGNFTLPLLMAGLDGVGIERTGASIRAARRAARAADLRDDSFIAADVLHELERRARRHEPFDLVVLDPPRTGARDGAPNLLALAPRYIAFCSCDPVTMARDLKLLCGGGYELERVTGFDMFPQTHHVEALAWLARRD